MVLSPNRAANGRALSSLWVVLLLVGLFCLAGCQNEKAAAEGKTPAISTMHLEDFVVNLADEDGRSYLRVGIDLDLEGDVPKAKSVVPMVRDSVVMLLSAQKADDVLTNDGKTKLKQGLIKTLNDRMPELKVQKIYFNNFMVQR